MTRYYINYIIEMSDIVEATDLKELLSKYDLSAITSMLVKDLDRNVIVYDQDEEEWG